MVTTRNKVDSCTFNTALAARIKEDFALIRDMIGERAYFQFNDGDYSGHSAIQAAFGLSLGEHRRQGAARGLIRAVCAGRLANALPAEDYLLPRTSQSQRFARPSPEAMT